MSSGDAWSTATLPSGEQRLKLHGLELTVTRGPDKGATAAATGAELTVGSGDGNTLKLGDPTVSRNHLLIDTRPEGIRVRDLGSTNGTFVGGVRIVEAWLEDGALLELGKTSLKLRTGKRPLEVPLHVTGSFGAMLGRSTAMRHAFAMLERAARSDATVLLLGESGTGKDLAAEALHQASARAQGPFVVVDCGAIAPSLIESELFGHAKGSFTGASERREGAFEAADQGTVFLDEIGELPLTLQPKLLRALERKTVKPVGANDALDVDVRFVAATNRDLRAEVNRGTFREDLFFRLSAISVRLPPLRERRDDIPLLVERILEALGNDTRLPDSLRERLMTHDWPGNVRELRHAVERAVILGDAWSSAPGTSTPAKGDGAALPQFKDAKQEVIDRFERDYLAALLASTEGNVSAAARQAGIDRVYLLKLLRRHRLR